ncbi:MAG: LysM peptidoglycan-binding domain-containing protein [Anaerolineaceae bacterium]
MKKNIFVLLIFTLIVGLSATACTRSATKAQTGPATETAEIPFPVGPTNRLTEVIGSTQTAAATPGTKSGETSVPTQPVVVVQNTPVPPTPTFVPIPTGTPGRPTTYTLQEGEFLYCIGRRFDVNVGDLMAVNGVSDSVSPGTTLTIPSDSKWPAEFERALKAHPTQYTVKSGDTIYTIACGFGDVDPNNIIVANNLKSPYTLTAGQVLQIP